MQGHTRQPFDGPVHRVEDVREEMEAAKKAAMTPERCARIKALVADLVEGHRGILELFAKDD